MADNSQEQGKENLEEQNLTEETENQDENSADDSSASDEGEVASRLNAFEAQLERQKAENESLRESLRLQSQYLQQQGGGGKQKPELSPELAELGKAINPLLAEAVNESVQPVVGTVSRLFDQTDAVSFQLDLQREDPELLKGDQFDRVSQVVESVRQRAAREQGSWISRKDAYLYAKGAGLLKKVEKKKPVSGEEQKRKKSVAAAQSAGAGSETRRSADSVAPEIQRIREKAHRGERLTAEERAKWKQSLGDVQF